MIAQYIQSIEAQDIANRIHFIRMQVQYDQFVWNDDPENVPEDRATPERIQEIWGADKLFLDCTESEAIDKYSLIGFINGAPAITYGEDSEGELTTELDGVTKAYANSSTVEGNNNCIPVPEDGIENYDLSEFTFEVIDIDFPE